MTVGEDRDLLRILMKKSGQV